MANFSTSVMPISAKWYNIAYGNNIYVACGYYGTTYINISYSYDGVNWHTAIDNISLGSTSTMFNLVFDGTYFVMVYFDSFATTKNKTYYSVDGINWSVGGTFIPFDYTQNLLTGNGMVVNFDDGRFYYTLNHGATWLYKNIGFYCNTCGGFYSDYSSKFYFMRDNTYQIYETIDGTSFTACGAVLPTYCYRWYEIGSRKFAISTSGAIYYSDNNWSTYTTATETFPETFTYLYRQMPHNYNDKIYMNSIANTNKFYTSIDGLNWVTETLPETLYWYNILVANSRILVTSGTSVIAIAYTSFTITQNLTELTSTISSIFTPGDDDLAGVLTPSHYFRLPNNIIITIDGVGYTGYYYDMTGNVTIPAEDITGNVIITAAAIPIETTYQFTHNLTNCTTNMPFVCYEGQNISGKITADDGYGLPQNIIVKINNVVVSSYTWNYLTGWLYIDGVYVNNNVDLTVIAIPYVNVTPILTGCTIAGIFNPILKGTAISATLSPTAGYILPEKITVFVGGYKTLQFIYNNQTGAIYISGGVVINDVSIVAVGETRFTCVFYRNTAEKNRVNKSAFLSTVISVEGVLREPSSIYNPVITFEDINNVIPSANYIYIDSFSRYYFITDIVSVSRGLWRVSCKCDVLMSFKTGIGNLSAVIQRQENSYNSELVDNNVPIENKPEISITEITSATNPFKAQTETLTNNIIITAIIGS